MFRRRLVLIIAVVSALLGMIYAYRKHQTRPAEPIYVDQLDIKTENPQPAGRNLTP